MVKTVYLVRHGQSEDNVEDDKPLKGPAALLTGRGREEARLIGERCANLDIDTIIASTYPRAHETAGIINERIKKPIDYSDIFIEYRSPSDKYRKSKQDASKLFALIDSNMHIADFRHSDEEGAEELGKRCGEALKYLEQRPEQNILVVSHAMFLCALMAHVLFGDDTTIRETARCARIFKMANTGLSILQYNPEDSVYGPWRLVCWNDHAHLG